VGSAAHLRVIPGSGPVVWLAPHGGRRDAARRPWARERLRVNDLHTAALAEELARATAAPALVNEVHDRNDVDLNRVVEAHDAAPWFLERLEELLAAALRRHGRATVLVVHGWNVTQPSVDLGLGCLPGVDPFTVPRTAAVSAAFAAGPLRRLAAACDARGIGTTVGARYPARHRENLLQLFTPRYRDDPRPQVRALARLAPDVDAVQLELGIPLRWPGAWRARFVDACREALPALAGAAPADDGGGAHVPAERAPLPGRPRRIEFTSPGLSGLAAVDAGRGGRLLLFAPDGTLALFTGERLGPAPDGHVGTLALEHGAGRFAVRFAGPLLRFPDATPFVDLEHGLARAALIDAEVALELTPFHAAEGDGGEFGRVTGAVTLAGARVPIDGDAFAEEGAPPLPWPRLRAAFHLDGDTRLALTVGLDGGEAAGFLCRTDAHHEVASARVRLEPAAGDSRRIALEVRLAGGDRFDLRLDAYHRLPVVRAHRPRPLRLEYLACRLDGARRPAGWCELAGL
jgi:hypothetical protein